MRPPLFHGYQRGLVRALPAGVLGSRRRLSASPLRWLGDSPWVPGTRPYERVPPLPVLSEINVRTTSFPWSDHHTDPTRTFVGSAAVKCGGARTTVSSRPRSSGTVTLESVGSARRAAL